MKGATGGGPDARDVTPGARRSGLTPPDPQPPAPASASTAAARTAASSEAAASNKIWAALVGRGAGGAECVELRRDPPVRIAPPASWGGTRRPSGEAESVRPNWAGRRLPAASAGPSAVAAVFFRTAATAAIGASGPVSGPAVDDNFKAVAASGRRPRSPPSSAGCRRTAGTAGTGFRRRPQPSSPAPSRPAPRTATRFVRPSASRAPRSPQQFQAGLDRQIVVRGGPAPPRTARRATSARRSRRGGRCRARRSPRRRRSAVRRSPTLTDLPSDR